MKIQQFVIIFSNILKLYNFELYLNKFSNDGIVDKGFLFKKLPKNNYFQPIKFSKINYDQLKTLCLELGYLSIHAVSYPKKLDKNEYENYIHQNCQINCE